MPGVLFSFMGTWWMLQTWRKYFKTLLVCERNQNNNKHNKFQSEALYSVFVCGRIDLLALLVVTSTVVGIMGELSIGPSFGNSVIKPRNIQHSAMYAFFMMFGVIELFKGSIYIPLLVLGS